MNFPRLLATVATALSVLMCSQAFAGGGCSAEPSEASMAYFEDNFQELFNEECVVCHLTGASNAELNLEPGLAIENLWAVSSTQVDLMRVEPGNAENSYLIHKLKGTHIEVGGEGDMMPMGLAAIDKEVISAIENWIETCR